MSKVDNRAVEMQFDNKQFESGVGTSIKSLAQLKNGLNLEGAVKGLSNLNALAKSLSLGSIAEGISHISSKFSEFGIIGITVLQNLTNQALNAGKTIVKALTIDPVSMGFSEYELKMGSIQTIMAGTGESLETVNKHLGDLNTYSDKTIYSFADMTSNIGKFTNAGVSLKDSVGAIKGVANVAALSGANAEEASRAMYNFGQALSSGSVKLIDWKSIELANMGTKEFKTQLMDAAVAAGTLTKAADGTYKTLKNTPISATKGFNESLTEQWMTSKVLTTTLGKYADATTDIGKRATSAAQDVKTVTMLYGTLKEAAQSGWAQTWEILIGDFEEAKVLLKGINEVVGGFIGASADARNALLSGWKDLGGRASLIEAFGNAFKGLMSVLKPIKEAFREIFPPMTAKQLFNITEGVRKFTEKLIVSEATADKIKSVFKGLFSVLDIGKEIVFAVAHGIGQLVSSLTGGSGGILTFAGNIGEWLVSLDEAIKRFGVFTIAVRVIEGVIHTVSTAFKTAVSVISGFVSSFGSAAGAIETSSVSFKLSFDPIVNFFDGLKDTLSSMMIYLGPMAGSLILVITSIATAISELFFALSRSFKSTGGSDIFDVIKTGVLVAGLLQLRKAIKSVSEIAGSISEITSGVVGVLDGVRGALKAYQQDVKSKVILRIAIAIGLLAASILVLSMIDSGKLREAIAAITLLFVELSASMAVLTALSKGTGFGQMAAISIGLIGMSVAVLLLSVAMKALSGLSWTEMTVGLITLGALITMLIAVSKVMKDSSVDMLKSALGLIAFAAAVKIMATSIEKLANVAKLIGSMDAGTIAKGLAGIGVILAELMVFLKVSKVDKIGVKNSAGLFLLATALNLIAIAMGKIGGMDVATITKGLVTIGLIIGELVLFTQLSGGKDGLMKTATGLLLLAGALVLISMVMQQLAEMSTGDIVKSLITIAAALGVLIVAMKFMTGALAGAAALIVIAGALFILTEVLTRMAELSITDIVKGLVTIAAMIALFAVSALLLAPVIPLMLALGVALGLMGIAMLAAGAGMLLFSMALASLAVSGAAGATALVGIVTQLATLIPTVMTEVGKGLVALAQEIIKGAPVIIKAFVTIVDGILNAMIGLAPKVGVLATTMLTTLLGVLTKSIPQMVTAGMEIIAGVLKGIADHIGEVLTQGANIIINFIKGISDNYLRVVNAAFDTVIKFINGLATAIRTKGPQLKAACTNLIKAIIGFLNPMTGQFKPLGVNIIKGLIKGMLSMVKEAGRTAANAAKTIVEAAAAALGIDSPSKVFAKLGKQTGEGMIVGIKGIARKVASTAADMAKGTAGAMADGIKGVSNVLNTDIDLQPTIRPVVDMTDVQNGINSEFSKKHAIDVSAATIKAGKVSNSTGVKPTSVGVASSVTDNTNNAKISIVNHYSVRNDTDIRKISKDLKNTLDRHSLAKGVMA